MKLCLTLGVTPSKKNGPQFESHGEAEQLLRFLDPRAQALVKFRAQQMGKEDRYILLR